MTLISIAREALPLMVLGVQVTDPVLTMFGERWGLTLMCPWTTRGATYLTCWESGHVADEARELVGLSIESITGGPDLLDPVFHLTGGIDLLVHADTDADPWTLSLPAITIVGRKP